LFMHFLGASRDGLVTRRVDLDTISSSVATWWANGVTKLLLWQMQGTKSHRALVV